MTSTINKFLVAIVSAIGQAVLFLQDSSAGGDAILTVEWLGIILAGAAAVGVFVVPYATSRGTTTPVQGP